LGQQKADLAKLQELEAALIAIVRDFNEKSTNALIESAIGKLGEEIVF
jgi:hypothetical protein